MGRWKRKTARGALRSKRCVRRRTTSWRALSAIEDRNAAEKLRNVDLYIPRARLPEIDEADTFYHADLIGLKAVTRSGDEVGTVSAIHNFGASDVIEIKPPAGEPLLMPFTDATVPEIDLSARRIVVVPPTET